MGKFIVMAWLLELGAGMVFTLRSHYYFDRLLRKLYAEEPEVWLNWGKPCGFFWVPPEARKQLVASGIMRTRLYRAWLNRMPSAGEAGELAKFRRFSELASSVFVIACITFVIMMVLIVWPFR